jgi:hypothetical protein
MKTYKHQTQLLVKIDMVINKAIDDVNGRGYTTAKRETSLSQGLKKGGLNGTL